MPVIKNARKLHVQHIEEEEEEFIFRTEPNIKMNKHVNIVRKATGKAEAITAGRQQNKQQYLIIQ